MASSTPSEYMMETCLCLATVDDLDLTVVTQMLSYGANTSPRTFYPKQLTQRQHFMVRDFPTPVRKLCQCQLGRL